MKSVKRAPQKSSVVAVLELKYLVFLLAIKIHNISLQGEPQLKFYLADPHMHTRLSLVHLSLSDRLNAKAEEQANTFLPSNKMNVKR